MTNAEVYLVCTRNYWNVREEIDLKSCQTTAYLWPQINKNLERKTAVYLRHMVGVTTKETYKIGLYGGSHH